LLAAPCETISVPAAQTELPPALGAPAPVPAPPRAASRSAGASLAPLFNAGRGLWWITLVIAAIFCFITFHAKGGLNLESMTSTEMALTVASGIIVAAGVILAPAGARAYGLWSVVLLLLFSAVTAISLVWSVQPDHSWQDSGRMLAYSGVFVAGVALVRVIPDRWAAILGGLTLAALIVCGYALLTKVFPASLDPADTFARLNEPYGYWNAVGSTAAMGTICCLWLGARRTGHALLRALAYPAMSLLLLTLMLAYSRGALVALAVGVLLWFCVVPLRLRSATLLILAGLAAGAVAAWDFSKHALSAEAVPLAQRTAAGHQLGALVVAMLLALAAVGVAIGFLTGRQAPSLIMRRRAGAALLAVLVLLAIAFVGALAVSHRGLTGNISHAFDSLTDPNAKPPGNTPGRLTAVASERARYWKEALQVFDAHPLLGSGAEGYATAHLRYETQTLEVRHAHSFILQTLADLGVLGLLVALALLCTWLAAAVRATQPFKRRTRYTPERVGMLSMLCVVVVFGAHSLIDWTWYVPGVACVALLCAGWLAGRGPLSAAALAGSPARTAAAADKPSAPLRASLTARPSNMRMLIAAAAIVAALLAAWSQWQPQRSEEAREQADVQLDAHNLPAATAAAKLAVSRDPLSVEALSTLASIQQVAGRDAQARATLERAVRLQPSNPQPWLVLGRYDLANNNPKAAVKELQASIYLNPQSIAPEAIANGEREAIEVHNDYIQALQGAAQQEALAAAALTRRQAALKSASEARARAAAAARRAGRRRSAR
jgi:hypothetical protein